MCEVTRVYNEAALEEALQGLYEQWGRDLGFWARRLHQKFTPGRKNYVGGVAAVRSVLNSRTAGFSMLQEQGRLDLSIESLILQPEWESLFLDSDRTLARARLSRMSR
jgi:hypothetical protein